MRKLSSPTYCAVVLNQLEQPVLLERELERGCRSGSRGSPRARATTGRRRRYGTDAAARRAARSSRRRRDPAVAAAAASAVGSLLLRRARRWLRVCEMFSSPTCAACLTVRLTGEDLGEHRLQDVAVLDVDPVLRLRDEPAARGSPLVDAVAEQVGRVRDVALRLPAPSRSRAREVGDPCPGLSLRVALAAAPRDRSRRGSPASACPACGSASRTAS